MTGPTEAFGPSARHRSDRVERRRDGRLNCVRCGEGGGVSVDVRV